MIETPLDMAIAEGLIYMVDAAFPRVYRWCSDGAAFDADPTRNQYAEAERIAEMLKDYHPRVHNWSRKWTTKKPEGPPRPAWSKGSRRLLHFVVNRGRIWWLDEDANQPTPIYLKPGETRSLRAILDEARADRTERAARTERAPAGAAQIEEPLPALSWRTAEDMGKTYDGFVDESNNWFVRRIQRWAASGRHGTLGEFETPELAQAACEAKMREQAKGWFYLAPRPGRVRVKRVLVYEGPADKVFSDLARTGVPANGSKVVSLSQNYTIRSMTFDPQPIGSREDAVRALRQQAAIYGFDLIPRKPEGT